MADNTNALFVTHTDNQKSFFLVRMVRIVKQNSICVLEYGLCFVKGYSMLALVDVVFVFIPFKGRCSTSFIFILYVFYKYLST